jgi:hypothetical protein
MYPTSRRAEKAGVRFAAGLQVHARRAGVDGGTHIWHVQQEQEGYDADQFRVIRAPEVAVALQLCRHMLFDRRPAVYAMLTTTSSHSHAYAIQGHLAQNPTPAFSNARAASTPHPHIHIPRAFNREPGSCARRCTQIESILHGLQHLNRDTTCAPRLGPPLLQTTVELLRILRERAGRGSSKTA